MAIRKALLTIKGYCEKHTACDRCQLQGDLHCLLEEDIPADWDIEEMMKKRKGDNNEIHN